MICRKESGALYEQLVGKLEQQIADGTLRQGDKLPSENMLAKENSISRVTVRQALKLLSEMGLIETKKGIGSFVAVASDPNDVQNKVSSFLQRFEDNFKQAIQIKILIEPTIAKNAAKKPNSREIAQMADYWQCMHHAKSKKQYNELCVAFHLALVETAQNPLLLQFYQKLEKLEEMYLHDLLLPSDKSKKLRQTDIDQHGKILQAVRQGNSEMAYLYTLEHLQYFYNYYTNLQRNDADETEAK